MVLGTFGEGYIPRGRGQMWFFKSNPDSDSHTVPNTAMTNGTGIYDKVEGGIYTIDHDLGPTSVA